MKEKMKIKEEGLIGNEKIEEAIAALQREPTQELLAHALTVVRRRIRENGQVIVAVEPQAGDGPASDPGNPDAGREKLVDGIYQL